MKKPFRNDCGHLWHFRFFCLVFCTRGLEPAPTERHVCKRASLFFGLNLIADSGDYMMAKTDIAIRLSKTASIRESERTDYVRHGFYLKLFGICLREI